MGLGDEWSDTTPGSASKLNKTTIISGTGTYITSLDKSTHILFRADDSTGGLTADHIYLCSSDGLSLIDLSDINTHTHSSSTDGGILTDILRSNPDVLDSGLTLIAKPDKANWGNTGAATISNDTDVTSQEFSIKIDTGASSGTTGSLYQPSMEMDMSKRSFFKCMLRFGTASSLAAKIGIGMESLTVADTDFRKYGAEVCTTTNNNWWCRSATGSARSASDSGTSAMVTTRQSLRLEHYPDLGTPKIDMYINEGTVFTKTSNIPTTYASDDPAEDNIFKVSLKNNTAASRTLFFYGCRFVYQTSNDWN